MLGVGLLGLVTPAFASGQLVPCSPGIRPAPPGSGCAMLARQELGTLPRDTALFWHLDTYQARSTAENASLARSTVIDSRGVIWLLTIAPSSWRAPYGQHVATIGPLPLSRAEQFVAVYLHESLGPGTRTPPHRHPGTEVRYPLEGEACVETPAGILRQAVGSPPPPLTPGVPLQARAVGTAGSRTLILVLEDASMRQALPAADWVPTNQCGS